MAGLDDDETLRPHHENHKKTQLCGLGNQPYYRVIASYVIGNCFRNTLDQVVARRHSDADRCQYGRHCGSQVLTHLSYVGIA